MRNPFVGACLPFHVIAQAANAADADADAGDAQNS